MEGEKYYLGFDFSTQQIKLIAVDDNLKVVFEGHVKFDTDLPEFGTSGGACVHDDKVTVTAPAAMWVKALDMLLDQMKSEGFDFSKVAGISGDGQQHGSVYWKKGARNVLGNMQPDKSMYEQLKDCFSLKDSPIWQDASTGSQIIQLQDAIGGAMELARLTGSRGFERYTGTQIMKIYQTNREAYDNTERISLISSFAASLFMGDYAPIDFGDGSGMNLLDIRNKVWASKCLEACGPCLGDKLGEPVPSKTVVGNVSSYMSRKYGFPSTCKVVAFTGDNMCSLAGLAPRKGDIMVSLGSSDTVFLWLPEATPGTDGHIFVNPLDSNTFMGLVCFKNGSLTRENVMNRCAGSWKKFDEMLLKTPPGNNGNIGIYFDKKEIQPVAMGTFRFNENDERVESFPPEVEVRAVLEGQFLARLMYAKLCGLQIGPESRVIATGGASANQAILQIIADIFNTSVYITDVPNSAALGGCYRAKHALMPEGTPYSEVVKGLPEPTCACKHTPGLEKVYMPMLERYKKLEEKVAAM
ncbi:xylulose kinase-like isoform X1 [Mercenaria mercenaria]|uniref:xylulose kinase-like isoform X1 n=1 Tax=Mercenaria mercenaria TaxID=6596 RepID=UPI00234F5469|nr:xylulose kinase-like isoform X1 [Mercenaria mercenaria]